MSNYIWVLKGIKNILEGQWRPMCPANLLLAVSGRAIQLYEVEGQDAVTQDQQLVLLRLLSRVRDTQKDRVYRVKFNRKEQSWFYTFGKYCTIQFTFFKQWRFLKSASCLIWRGRHSRVNELIWTRDCVEVWAMIIGNHLDWVDGRDFAPSTWKDK